MRAKERNLFRVGFCLQVGLKTVQLLPEDPEPAKRRSEKTKVGKDPSRKVRNLLCGQAPFNSFSFQTFKFLGKNVFEGEELPFPQRPVGRRLFEEPCPVYSFLARTLLQARGVVTFPTGIALVTAQ